MNVYDITSKSLTREFGEEVPDVYVIIAKHLVMGLDESQVAETLSCGVADIQLVTMEPLFDRVKSYIAGARAEETVDTASGWDAIEALAVGKLLKRLEFEKDVDVLLRTAAVANRMVRRSPVPNNILDPGLRAGRTTITLTSRLVSKINGRGETETEATKQLSIQDGSMGNPSFQEVDQLLSVQNQPVLPRAKEIQVHAADNLTQSDLDQELEAFMRKR